MKGTMKIISHYVLSAAGIALMLLIINFLIIAVWGRESSHAAWKNGNVSQLAAGLTKTNENYILSDNSVQKIEKNYSWAMLLDNGGKIIWSFRLPDELKHSYSVSDVASFSHWYLNDYPVYVWEHPDGLFVLGAEKGSAWKHGIEMPQKLMDNTTTWVLVALIINCIAALLAASLLGLKLYKSLKPLAEGIGCLAENRAVNLPTKGLLGDLALGINRASKQLKMQEYALSKRDNARTAWIAGVSHDIRTPLSVVMGYAGELEDDSQLPESKREQAGIIRKQSEKIKCLVNDLNLASKLEYDMQPLRKSNITISALLREVAADFLNSGIPERYSIELNIYDNAQNMQIFADEELIKRAVSNTLSNSIRHNENGCSIKISLERKLENCVITINDNGVGFPSEILDALQKSPETATLNNHGLGLTIVRQILKAHEGKTEFRNTDVCGCEIILSIPIRNE